MILPCLGVSKIIFIDFKGEAQYNECIGFPYYMGVKDLFFAIYTAIALLQHYLATTVQLAESIPGFDYNLVNIFLALLNIFSAIPGEKYFLDVHF